MIEQERIELNRLADANIKLAQQYADARVIAARFRYNLDVILASKITEVRANTRANIGYDMAIIELMKGEDADEIIEYHKEVLRNESICDGLKLVIKANEQKLSLNQSIMKYTKENT